MLAVANYEQANGHYPPAFLADADGGPMRSWRILVLPYIEGDSLFKRYDPAEPWDGPNNGLLAAEMPRTFAFHGVHRPGRTTTNYLAVVGPETAWPAPKKLSAK